MSVEHSNTLRTHHVLTDTETLFEKAPMTADNYLMHAITDIDKRLGKGYAKAHPELIAAYMQTAAMDFGSAVIARAVETMARTSASASANAGEQVAEAIESVAVQLKYLGVGDAASTMGAVEFLAVQIKEGLEMLAHSDR